MRCLYYFSGVGMVYVSTRRSTNLLMEAGESGRNMESVPDLVEEVLKHPSENATVQGMSELFHSLNNKYIKYNLYKGSHHKGTVKPV